MDIACATKKYCDIRTNTELYEKMAAAIFTVAKLLLHLSVTALECLFGLHLGAIAGWCGGWFMGSGYQNTCNSVALSSFEEIQNWYFLPHTFGQYGAIAGALIGTLAVIFISKRIKRNRILDLYQKGVTRPYDLAKFTGLSRQRVEWILSHNIEEYENEVND